jgi:hypothetical protein
MEAPSGVEICGLGPVWAMTGEAFERGKEAALRERVEAAELHFECRVSWISSTASTTLTEDQIEFLRRYGQTRKTEAAGAPRERSGRCTICCSPTKTPSRRSIYAATRMAWA